MPAYEPGTRHGYHALTYGWLAGELIRRVSGRPVAVFVQEELARPLRLDGLYVGCPPGQRGRVAPLAPMAAPLGRRLGLRPGAVMGGPIGRIPALLGLPVSPRRFVNALLPRGIEDVLWCPEVMDAEIPAANGFFTARSLAKLYALLAHGGQAGGVRLLSPRTVQQIAVVHSRGPDLVLVLPMGWRLGYHSAFTTRRTVPGAFGHFGFGGSGGSADPRRDVALAMVCNRGSGTPIGDLRMAELGAAVVRSPGVASLGDKLPAIRRPAARLAAFADGQSGRGGFCSPWVSCPRRSASRRRCSASACWPAASESCCFAAAVACSSCAEMRLCAACSASSAAAARSSAARRACDASAVARASASWRASCISSCSWRSAANAVSSASRRVPSRACRAVSCSARNCRLRFALIAA